MIVGVLGLMAIVASYLFRGIPRVASNALRNAESFELLSLDPEPGREDADFNRFKVLGRTNVTDAGTRQRLFDALQSGARPNIPIPSCFNPRHGIRVVADGRTIDFVICFECSRVQVWEGDTLVTGFIVGQSPAPVFNQALQDAGLPLAPK